MKYKKNQDTYGKFVNEFIKKEATVSIASSEKYNVHLQNVLVTDKALTKNDIRTINKA